MRLRMIEYLILYGESWLERISDVSEKIYLYSSHIFLGFGS